MSRKDKAYLCSLFSWGSVSLVCLLAWKGPASSRHLGSGEAPRGLEEGSEGDSRAGSLSKFQASSSQGTNTASSFSFLSSFIFSPTSSHSLQKVSYQSITANKEGLGLNLKSWSLVADQDGRWLQLWVWLWIHPPLWLVREFERSLQLK